MPTQEVIHGDCLDVMRGMEPESVDTIITDPPYGLAFMGQQWDHGVPGVPFWTAALRVAKPGAMMLAFGGTRTHHRLMCAIEDAGWEIRDCMMWLYGSGFPKSHDISKAIGKAAGVETTPATDLARQWGGWGTALKPAWEPIVVAMKPLDGTFAQNAEKWGVAGLWIDGGRIGTDEDCARKRTLVSDTSAPFGKGAEMGGNGRPAGRFPANVILDEDAGAMLDEQSGECGAFAPVKRGHDGKSQGIYGDFAQKGDDGASFHNDSGGASRFFYCAKVSRAERTDGGRIDNNHPTVKPVSLLRYLCRLTKTPTGGLVLDPFTGSGSTGIACIEEERDFIGIESNADYVEIARRRIEAVAVLT